MTRTEVTKERSRIKRMRPAQPGTRRRNGVMRGAHIKSRRTKRSAATIHPRTKTRLHRPARRMHRHRFSRFLGDVLPQDASSSANANGTHAGPSGPTGQFSQLAQMAFNAGLAGGNAAASLTMNENAMAGSQTDVAGNTGVADKTSETAVASAADGSGAHRQTELSAAFDGAFATKAQATANGPGTAQAQKQAEVAFAARIAERTATGAALGLNDAQATIAASRFDATSTGGQSGENHHGAANSGGSETDCSARCI